MKNFVLQKTSPFASVTSSRPCTRIVPEENQKLAPSDPEVPVLMAEECCQTEQETDSATA